LIALNIDPNSYCLDDGYSNEALCLHNNYGKWSIYYSEKGLRTDEKFYNNEDDACKEFLVQIKEMLGI
jgi:hypothetical protein